MSDMNLECDACGKPFVWTHEAQVAAVKAIPLDDLLDAPEHERPHFVDPPKRCARCTE